MNKRISFILVLATIIVVAVAAGQPSRVAYAGDKPTKTPKPTATSTQHVEVTICHWDNGHGGEYQTITVDDDGSYSGHSHHANDLIPAPAGGCPQATPTPTATLVPTLVPTATPTDEPTATPTATPIFTETPIFTATVNVTDVPTATPTDEVTPTPSEEPTTERPCDEVVCGYLFHLIGPDGQEADFASFSPRPDGGWYLPNAGAQLECLGWVAVRAPYGREIGPAEAAALISCQGGNCTPAG